MYGTKDGRYWQRIKLWILLAGIADEDYGLHPLYPSGISRHPDTGVAASACLSALSTFPDVVERIFEERQGVSIVKELVVRAHRPSHPRPPPCRDLATCRCSCAA